MTGISFPSNLASLDPVEDFTRYVKDGLWNAEMVFALVKKDIIPITIAYEICKYDKRFQKLTMET